MPIKSIIIAFLILFILYKISPYFLLKEGLSKLEKNKKARGLSLLNMAIKLNINPRLQLTIGYAFLKENQIDKAIKCFKTVENKYKNKEGLNQEAQSYYALALWQKGEQDQGISLLYNLLDQNYQTTALYTNLGFFLNAKQNFNKALELNLKAFDYDKESKGILDNLGASYIGLEKWDDAAKIYTDLFESEILFPEAYYNFAKVQRQQGNKNKAKTLLEQGLSMEFTPLSTIKKEDLILLKDSLD